MVGAMLRAWMIRLAGPVPGGRCLHGLLFSELAAASPGLAADLHRPDMRRPFTWSVPPDARDPDGTARCVRLTAWGPPAEVLDGAAWLAPGTTRTTAEGPFTVADRTGDPARSRWCGSTDWGELLASTVAAQCPERTAAEADPDETGGMLSVMFHTPTAVRGAVGAAPSFEGALLVRSWLSAWAAAGGPEWEPDVAAALQSQVRIVQDETAPATALLRPGNPRGGAERGRVGRVVLDIDGGEAAGPGSGEGALRAVLRSLAQAAFWLGTGRKTAMGMGLTAPAGSGGPWPRGHDQAEVDGRGPVTGVGEIGSGRSVAPVTEPV